MLISWLIGALVLKAAFALWLVFNGGGPHSIGWATLALVPLSLLGFFLGMFTVWPSVRNFCSEKNCPNLSVDDRVVVLRGSDQGTIATVYEITQGQGGQYVARVEMGQLKKSTCEDVIEYYSLLKIKNIEQSLNQ